jgi:hypothetical protein
MCECLCACVLSCGKHAFSALLLASTTGSELTLWYVNACVFVWWTMSFKLSVFSAAVCPHLPTVHPLRWHVWACVCVYVFLHLNTAISDNHQRSMPRYVRACVCECVRIWQQFVPLHATYSKYWIKHGMHYPAQHKAFALMQKENHTHFLWPSHISINMRRKWRGKRGLSPSLLSPLILYILAHHARARTHPQHHTLTHHTHTDTHTHTWDPKRHPLQHRIPCRHPLQEVVAKHHVSKVNSTCKHTRIHHLKPANWVKELS